jgi:hypothetical protein
MTEQLETSDTTERLLALLGQIAGALTDISRYLAPAAPDMRHDIREFHDFDWAAIGAEVVQADDFGPALVEWNGRIFKRRSPENKFGTAIWFSAPSGKKPDGTTDYARLITFKQFDEAEPISRAAEKATAAASAPVAPLRVQPAGQVAHDEHPKAAAAPTPPAVATQAAANTAAVIANLPAADAAGQKPASQAAAAQPAPSAPTAPAAATRQTVTVHNAQTAADTADKRPWGMAKLKAKLLAKAAYGKKHPEGVIVNGKYGAAIGQLDKACAGADHHILISEVFGVSQARDLLPEQKWAIAEWAAPTKNEGTGLWALPQTVLIEFRNLAQCAEGGTPMLE